MNRCIDLEIGQKVLSYDLLEGEEKRLMDAHLEHCAACRDFVQQTLGKQGALDEIAWRAWRLSQRQRVEPHAWVMARLRDLWPAFLVVACLVGVVSVFLARQGPEKPSVRVLRLWLMRAGSLDSAATPHVEVGPSAVIVRPDRQARAYVYELRERAMRRLVPAAERPAPELEAGETRELPLPPVEGPESQLLLVLVPRTAGGTTDEWDAAVLAQLGGGPGTQDGNLAWPGGIRPTLRWFR